MFTLHAHPISSAQACGVSDFKFGSSAANNLAGVYQKAPPAGCQLAVCARFPTEVCQSIFQFKTELACTLYGVLNHIQELHSSHANTTAITGCSLVALLLCLTVSEQLSPAPAFEVLGAVTAGRCNFLPKRL